MVVSDNDLCPIGLLVISFSTNVDITHPLGSNRSFWLVMYDLVTWVDNWIFKVQVYPDCILLLNTLPYNCSSFPLYS